MDQYFTAPLPDPTPSPKRKLSAAWNILRDLFQTALLSVLIFVSINAVTARIRIESVSMQPTLFESDFVLVNRMAYQLGANPGRKDVIVFQPPLEQVEEPYIKRVIGLPGDRVHISNGKVFVNGERLVETYLSAPPRYQGEWIVPLGSVFVLGDNRNNSSDSHQWGVVPLENILGEALVVYWPLEHWKVLNPAAAAAAEP